MSSPPSSHSPTDLRDAGSDDHALRLNSASDGAFTLGAVTADILRIAFTRRDAPPHRTWALAPGVAALPAPATTLERAATVLRLRTATLVATVTRDPTATFGGPAVRVTRADGALLAADAAESAWSIGADGTLRWSLALQPGERIFGGGQRTGGLDQRGRTLTLWSTDPLPPHGDQTDAMYQSVSNFVGLRPDGTAWGVFYDSSWHASLDIGQRAPDRLTFTTTGPDLVAYLLAGPTLADVVAQYTTLTGRMPPQPRWSLGNQQSRWSYLSADEVRAVAAGFREHAIPCDALYLDIDYMRGYRDFTFNPQTFPDPPGLIRELAAQGFRVVPIIDPGVKVDPAYSVYADGRARGFFARGADGAPFEGYVWPGRSVWADFARPEVRAWWGEQHADLAAAGVAGIWDDMNEPSQAGMNAPPDVTIPFGATLPPDVQHGPPEAPLSHAEFHNFYGHAMAQATFEGLAHLRPDTRPFVLSRAAGAGTQRYAIVWNGDNTSMWPHVRLAVTMNLGVGLSGFPVTGFDIGGFWQDTTPELLVRFTQIGAFMGFCRNHSALGTVSQEPWAFGDPYTSYIRAAIERRYRLLPLFATLFHAASATGAPVVRSLAWIAPDDPDSVACDDQFLLGDDLLVAPVLEEGATQRAVVLPPGAWSEWTTGVLHSGPGRVTVPVDLGTTPIFTRAGAILPTTTVTQHTGEAPGPLTLEAHLTGPGATATGAVWDDDDHPLAEQRGSFLHLRAAAEWTGDTITARVERVGGRMAPRYPAVRVALRLPPGVRAVPEDAPEGDLAALPLTFRWRVVA